MTDESDRPRTPTRHAVPAPIAWASRHGGWILFALLLSVAMIEAVALIAARRQVVTAPAAQL